MASYPIGHPQNSGVYETTRRVTDRRGAADDRVGGVLMRESTVGGKAYLDLRPRV